MMMSAQISLHPEQLREAAARLRDSGGRMQMVYAWYPEPSRLELRYVVTEAGQRPFGIWRCEPRGPVPSLAAIWPLMSWYEREVSDLFGLQFLEHPQPQRLVLHDGVDPVRPPFDPEYPGNMMLVAEPSTRAIPDVGGAQADVQLLPFGPVRADVVESGEFFFYYIGETILHYHPRLFFKHRGMEKRFEGLAAARAVILAERVSGVGSVAHALAYCQAVEAAANCEVPPRARFLRVLLAELERLYNHLHYLGHLCHTTTLKVGEAEGKLLEERAKQLNTRLTGSRFLRGVLTIGGLRHDLSPKEWLSAELEALREKSSIYARHLENTDSHLDRLITTGKLDPRVAFDQGATGPIDRASGLDRDLRRDHPYAAYGELPLTVAVREGGDAHARAQVRIAEIDSSIALMQRVLLLLPDGSVRSDCSVPPNGEGLGFAESPRGTLFYAVHFDGNAKLARVKIKSPSFSNWRAFPFTVHDSNMMDYAINEASFGLTIAGCDR
ncbi:MAG TPA: NADH-quinone oxidoreductase subunit C [Xanthobacteraceae bacterium]|nr:NADH-quinone oxidoreductase subunit C [Xanthobacteraceae bacterium]